jgi:hypothetical protein
MASPPAIAAVRRVTARVVAGISHQLATLALVAVYTFDRAAGDEAVQKVQDESVVCYVAQ